MALIKCTDCGKEISDKAKSCPNCGCPVVVEETKKETNVTNESKKNVVDDRTEKDSTKIREMKAPPPVISEKKKVSVPKIILGVIGGGICIVVLGLITVFVLIPIGDKLIKSTLTSTEPNTEEMVTFFEEETYIETVAPVVSTEAIVQENTTSETTQVQIIIAPATEKPKTENTTRKEDTFKPRLVYSNPFTDDCSRTSGYIVRAELIDYSVRSVYDDASIDIQFKLTEKSGEAYMDIWYFNIEDVSFYDANDNFLGSEQLVEEVTHLQVGDKFTTTLFNIPLETRKIVLN